MASKKKQGAQEPHDSYDPVEEAEKVLNPPEPEMPSAFELRVASRQRRVTSCYLQGLTIYEIAEKTYSNPKTVHTDLGEIRKRWIQASVADFGEKKAQELAKIDELERVSWEAWYHSLTDNETEIKRVEKARKTTITFGKGANGQHTQDKKESEELVPIKESLQLRRQGRTGDPRFLERVSWCIETRMKLLGFLKDVTINQSNNFNWDALTKELPEGPIPDVIEAKLTEAIRALPAPKEIDDVGRLELELEELKRKRGDHGTH